MNTERKTWTETHRPAWVKPGDWTAYLWSVAGQSAEVRRRRAVETGLPLVPMTVLA